MEELQIQISNTLGEITTNFEEIEANLKAVAADYKGIIVTEDSLKQCKKDVSELRKIIKDIEDSRKAIKKQWNVPYQQFEEKCKQLETVIEEPINAINNQVAVFEQKATNEKKEHLLDLYSANIEDFSEYIPFETTLDVKWKNVSYTDKDYLYDLSERKVKVRSDLDAIHALNSEIEADCLKAYKDSGNNLASAIKRNSDYLSIKQLAEKKVEEEKKVEVKAEPPKEEPTDDWMNKPVEYSFTFRVKGEDAQKVREYLNFAEIEYQEV